MRQFPAFGRPRPDALALTIERAGSAMACVYSSSDEFEAAVLRSKDARSGLGRRRHLIRFALVGLAVVLIWAWMA